MKSAEFRHVYGILPEPMLLLSACGTLLAANTAAVEVLGTAAFSGTTTLQDVADDDPDKIARLLTRWQRSRALSPSSLALKTCDDGARHFRVEGGLITPATDGEPARIVLRLVPKEARTERFLTLNQRIEALNKENAERQRAEYELARTNEELRRANSDLEQFAYSASHDLREPLRMISIYSDLLRSTLQGRIDEKSEQFLSYTVQGAKRMDALIHDLLSYTHAISVVTGPVVPTPADSALDVALSNLQHVIEENQATIDREPLPELAVQHVDLLQIFQNLISNALKYRSREPPKISVRARKQGPMWSISIRDNGIGIAPQYAEQVFGIFKRLHTSEKYPGTGVGLAICQKIVHRYGGRIWLESDQEGVGCRFHFTLPAAEAEPGCGKPRAATLTD